MFLIGLLIALLALDSLLLILIILIQKGKGSMGLGNLGGGTQMLFGGSGGQDLFQKTTWILGAIFMAGSLFLSIMWSKSAKQSISIASPVRTQSAPAQNNPNPVQQGSTQSNAPQKTSR